MAESPTGKDAAKKRRTPRQDRSRELVDAVVTAGLEILESVGPEGLTVRAVCKRAGVSAGSVYQYFETKDAVIAAVYQGLLTQHWREGLGRLSESIGTMPLHEVISTGVNFACDREMQLYELHPGFYRRYAYQLVLGGHKSDGGDALAAQLRENVLSRREDYRVRDVDSAAFIMVWGIAGLIRATLLERPEALRDPKFRQELVDMMTLYLLGNVPDTPGDSLTKRRPGQ